MILNTGEGHLSGILKKACVNDQDVDSYIERQNLLNKANISIDMFTQILDVVKVPTALDGGKALLKKLTEFDGLNEAIIVLKQDKQSLSGQVQDLDEKAKLRGLYKQISPICRYKKRNWTEQYQNS